MAMNIFRAAPLPNPPAQWDPQYMRQVIRVLENYFSQMDSNTPNHAQSYTADDFYGGNLHGNGVNIYMPHNQFLSNVDQSAAAIDQAYAVRLEITTLAPSFASSSAEERPMPRLEPVITATWPVRSNGVFFTVGCLPGSSFRDTRDSAWTRNPDVVVRDSGFAAARRPGMTAGYTSPPASVTRRR